MLPFFVGIYNWLMQKASASESYPGVGSMVSMYQNGRSCWRGYVFIENKGMLCSLVFELHESFILKFQTILEESTAFFFFMIVK